jgi:zinc/manganese transport system substrate-binding protein
MLLAATGCGSDDGASDEGDTITVIATTPVLADITSNIVGDAATVTALIPIGASPHDYAPSAQQATALQNADLVIANGLGLEEGLADLLEAARRDGTNVLEIAPLVDPIPFAGTDQAHDDDEDEGEDHEGDDPHFWLDPLRDADAARIIAGELAVIAPDGDWAASADRYAAELTAADGQIRDILSVIPSDGRKLVTNHDSFGYFAERYGFEVVGVVVPGGSTLAEPSSAELAGLVEEIRRTGVRAIFGDTSESADLANAIAGELDQTVEVVQLYTGSLDEPSTEAGTLIGMLITDARLIAEALS